MGRRPKVVITKQIGRGRPKKVYAVIPLDTKKIRHKILQTFKRRQKTLDRLNDQIQTYYNQELPEYNQYCMRICGAALSEERSVQEKLSLVQSRLAKIQVLARDMRISQVALVHWLREKTASDKDIWAVLEDEIVLYEERKKKEEEKRRKANEKYRHNMFKEYREFQKIKELRKKFGINSKEVDFDLLEKLFKKMGFDDCEDDFDGGWEFEDDAFSDFYISQQGNKSYMESDEAKDLKQLYRELCQKYHPDKVENYDEEAKRIWLEISAAYQSGDLEKLLAIRSRLNLGSDDRTLSCSELQSLIEDLEFTIRDTREEVRSVKKKNAWGFLKLSEDQKTKLIKTDLQQIQERCRNAKFELAGFESMIQDLLNAPLEPPKKCKKKKDRFEDTDFIQDILFGDGFDF